MSHVTTTTLLLVPPPTPLLFNWYYKQTDTETNEHKKKIRAQR